jgi:hypothetical protein
VAVDVDCWTAAGVVDVVGVVVVTAAGVVAVW